MTIKLLSTVKQLRFEDPNGVVLGRIERNARGVCVLIGEKPTRSHYQVVVYENPLRKEDRSFIVIAPTKAAPLDTAPMRPCRAD